MKYSSRTIHVQEGSDRYNFKKNLFSVRLQLKKKELNLASKGQAKKKTLIKETTSDFFPKLTIKSYAAKSKNQFYMVVLLKPGCG